MEYAIVLGDEKMMAALLDCLTEHLYCHIVETVYESYPFRQSRATAISRIKGRKQSRRE